MEVLTAIAGKIAELALIPIGRQMGYLLFYNKNFKELRDKIEELKSRKVRIEHVVEAERKNGREIEVDVVNWQNRVDETLEEVEKLCEDEPHANVQCWKWSFPKIKSRYQLGRKAKKMAFTIVELKEKGRFDGGLGHVPTSSMASLTFAARGSEKLESRNSLKEKVMLSLTNPKISKVGIYGLAGMGKTTLAKDVAKHVKDGNLFDVVAMATISEKLDVERVQDEIAYQLGFHLDEKTSIGRAESLCARIKLEKNILIILDDLWEKIDLNKLGIPSEQDLKGDKLSLTSKSLDISQKNSQGCKLLLTSRRLDILQKTGIQNHFALEAVNEAESWSLFEEIVGDAIKDASLKKIAAQVVERCAGLPVMIVSIAKSLKYNKNARYWRDALKNLKRFDKGDVYGTVFSAFEFTYKRLEHGEMQKVFLLCGVYGPSMLISDLLKYVIGLGILKHKDTIEDARNRLYSIIEDLRASCLLLEDDASETDVIKMHDLIREVAVSIAKKNEHVFVLKRNDDRMQDWPSKDSLERCTQIILQPCFIQELPQKLDCPNLKFFHLQYSNNCSLQIPDNFFEGMGNLEVLDLRGLIISSLPRSLVSLTKLKALCLDQCTLKHMAGIGALINLEILSFFDSSMEEFPSEIGQLAHLKMLDLSNSRIEIIPPNTLSKLTKLEELYIGNASIKWEEESSPKQNKSASLAELGCLTSLTALEIQIREAWILSLDMMMFDKLERYKVVIGDKWEWSSNKRTSGLLKLKLDTIIHLEPEIIALIKRVEDLYLDEVNGISDVLFDLKGEGFPLLKHLYIQNNGQVQHIINTMERNGTHDLFPELKTLILHNLNNLVKICHGPVPVNSFGKVTIIKVKSCNQLVYLFSVLMVKALSQLVEMKVSECSSMKRIVLIENEESGITTNDKIEFYSLRSLSLCHLPVIHNFCSNESTSCMTTTPLFNCIKVSFTSLETLKLSSINLEKIWDDDHLSAVNCMHNLANLIVEDCRGLKYLFSSSLIGSFLKLKQLEISKCEMMEDIIAPKGKNSIALEEVQFSKLETMVIKDMKSLKKVWDFEFERLKTLEVSDCGKLVNIFPSNMQRTFEKLETLKVSNCDLVEEIFELTAQDIQIEDETMTQVSQMKKLHLLGLPKLKQIWSRDAQKNLRFLNLQLVCVEDCENLEYLFPFSIAIQAIQLEHVTVKYAWSMKQIVLDKEGPMDSPVKFKFNHLTSLVLWVLHELEGFFAGNHSVLCPLLRELDIRQSGKLKIFKTQSTSDGQERVFDSKHQISMQQPLFTFEQMICNLERLALNSENASMLLQGQFSRKHFNKLKFLCLANFEHDHATFPYQLLQNITTLNRLVVECSSFREIFKEEIPIEDKGKFKIRTQIKGLILNQLYDLQYICKEGFEIDPVLEVLEYLLVDHCSNLKYLVPSSVTFCHLTYLEVENCNGLIYLITSSTARSLVKLTTMKIMNCNSLEQVVVEEREGSEDEIAFSCLEILELECLPVIKRFCSCNCLLNLPLLNEVAVKQCPRINIFSVGDTSTPKLQKISSKEEDGKVYWEGDLNRTINKMFVDKVAFSSFNHLEFSEYPELEELWYGQVGQKIFCNLKHLVVRQCTFLSNMIFSSNLMQVLYTLEELEVAECDSLEAIFDVKALDNKGIMESKEVSGLKKLTLSGLPNLKRVWNRETGEIISFGNLQIVKVDKCQHLQCLFSVSLCQDLRQLERLHIESCGVEEIVSIKEGLEEFKFDFPRLTSLELLNLTQLTNFCPKQYTLECPSLKTLNIRGCEELQIFAFDHLNSQPLREIDIELQSKQALFYIEKVLQNLEELPLNEKDTMMILKGNYEKNLFQSIKRLRLQHFRETPIKFLNDLIQKFPATTTLQARCSSFETLFPSKEIGHCGIESATQIKTLWLFQLEQLGNIWSDDDPASHPLIQHLEHMYIQECFRLIRLAPPLTSFTNLTTLEVEDCNRLMYFMTSFTAKSLGHLRSLTVRNCRMLEEVVMTNKGESEEEIIFKSLKYLELTCLSGFKSFCCGKHTFIFPSLVTLKVTGCQKMQNFSSGIILAPFLKVVKVEDEKKRWKGDLNTTIMHLFIDKAIREGEEGNYEESSSDITKSSQTHQMTESSTGASSSKKQVGQSRPNQIADTGKQKTYNIPSQSYDREQNEKALSGIERPLVQVTQNASNPSTNQDTEESQDSETLSSKNLSKQATTVNNKESLSKDTQEMGESIEKPLVEAAKIALSPTGVYDAAIGTQEIHDTMAKPLIQTNQEAEKLATTQNTDIESQKMCDTIKKPSSSSAQNVVNSTMIPDAAATDPPPSKASEPMTLSILESHAYNDYKGLIDISKQNLPHLEAGLKRHPQVLDWFNTKRRGVFAALFTEVTSILRTTRRCDLTEDDRNYIRECCAALEAVGFDASWLSYVHGCIESCGDEDELKRKLEETEAKASILRNELASVEASLVSLRDEASRLRNFIES